MRITQGDIELENTGNEEYATFEAHIIETPDQYITGNYQTTSQRRVVDKKTGKVTSGGYYKPWYQFLGILTSVGIDGQEHDKSLNLKIAICIASEQNGIPIAKLNHILPQIKIDSDIKFKGVLQRVDEEREIHPVKTTNIENAHEIYIDANYIDTIHVETPTKETLEKQNQYAQSRRKERSRRAKWGLKFRLKLFWQDIVKYVSENKIKLFVGFLLTLAAVVIGRVILHWLGVS